MKKPADDLFQLIKSLTQAEKRYFKVHAGKHVQGHINKYEKLFDAIDALPDDKPYDEITFKRSLRGKSYGKNLAQEKLYLQEILMETLRAFHAEASIDSQLYRLLAEEDIYRQKRLNKLREKTIEKAKELAQKYEKWEVLLMLLDRELGMNVEINQDDLLKIKGELGKMEAEVLCSINMWDTLKQFSYRIFIITRISTNAPNAEQLKEAEEIVNTDIVKNYKEGYSFQTDRHYYRIWAMYYRLVKDFKQHNFYTGQIYELYESKYPWQRAVSPIAYKVSIFNFLNSSHTAQDYSRFDELLTKVRAIKPTSTDEEGEDWQNIAFLEMLYLMNTGQLDKAAKLEPEILKGLNKYLAKINDSRRLSFWYNLSSIYFHLKNWSKALDYYNLISNDKTKARADLKETAQLLKIVCHYELGNVDLVESLCRSYERAKKQGNNIEIIRALKGGNKKKLALKNENGIKPELLLWLKGN